MALLRFLERLRDDLGITLAVMHFDHALRAAESEGDAEFVANLARAHGLEIVMDREDVAAEAQRKATIWKTWRGNCVTRFSSA